MAPADSLQVLPRLVELRSALPNCPHLPLQSLRQAYAPLSPLLAGPPAPTVFAVKVSDEHPQWAAPGEKEKAAVAVVTESPTHPGVLYKEG